MIWQGGYAWPTLMLNIIGYSVMHSTLPNSKLLEGFGVKFLGSAREGAWLKFQIDRYKNRPINAYVHTNIFTNIQLDISKFGNSVYISKYGRPLH